MAKDQPLFIRLDPEFRSRVKSHAKAPQFGGIESTFARYGLGIVMDLRDALGPRFDIEIARLLEESRDKTGAQAA